jgi:RHS repeat-associated protein
VYREHQEHDGVVDANTLSVQYEYEDGAYGGVAKYVRLSQVTYPDDREVHYGYGTTQAIDDVMSRLATIGDGAKTHASYKYLGAGRIVEEDYEDIEVRLDYAANNFAALDRFGRVLDQVWTDYGEDPDVVLDHYGYTYDRTGNRTSRDNELHSAFDEDYTYDGLDRLTDSDRADDSGEPGDLTTEYQYDGSNRRIRKIVSGMSHAHYFYNQEWQLLEERFVDSQGATVASNQYVWSARYIDAPIVRFHDGNGDGDLLDAADNTRYYTGDANYNVTATIDAGTGAVVERYAYTPYGAATVYDDTWSNPGAPTTDGPLYCGCFFDGETALYQVRNRYYVSSLSVCISRDPILADNTPYRYVHNNPAHGTDPSGLGGIDCVKATIKLASDLTVWSIMCPLCVGTAGTIFASFVPGGQPVGVGAFVLAPPTCGYCIGVTAHEALAAACPGSTTESARKKMLMDVDDNC